MKLIKKLKSLKNIPFTHNVIGSYLTNYKNPNDKIKNMVKNDELIRVKQSLYILGDIYRKEDISKELLANSMYGPSYISMDYALSFYGIIPERVYEVTSVTTKMAKNYNTPLGRFTYIKSPVNLYSKDIAIKTNKDNTSFMIATVEKALCDKIIFTQNLGISSIKNMLEYLEYDLRIDLNDLKKFDLNTIQNCMQDGYKNKLLNILYITIKKIQGD